MILIKVCCFAIFELLRLFVNSLSLCLAWAAGYVEGDLLSLSPSFLILKLRSFFFSFSGALTQQLIFAFYKAVARQHGAQRILDWLSKNYHSFREKVQEEREKREVKKVVTDETLYWYMADLILTQFEGMLAGHNEHCPKDKVDFLFPFLVCLPLSSFIS